MIGGNGDVDGMRMGDTEGRTAVRPLVPMRSSNFYGQNKLSIEVFWRMGMHRKKSSGVRPQYNHVEPQHRSTAAAQSHALLPSLGDIAYV